MNPRSRPPYQLEPLQARHAAACEAVGRALPDWFGIEEGLVDLRAEAEKGSGWVAIASGGVVAFLTLRQHFTETWEITWMAVAPAWRRHGLGRQLIDAAVAQCREAGAHILQVKTLADSHPSPEYAATRAFYRSLGFIPLEVFPELWGSANPCLLMARAL